MAYFQPLHPRSQNITTPGISCRRTHCGLKNRHPGENKPNGDFGFAGAGNCG